MKQKEKEIIKYLRKGKRVNISEIARELNLPVSTVRDRIKRIEDKYIIKRSSLLDNNKMGYSANTFLAITIIEKRLAFLNFLKQQKCVNSIYVINSGFNFLIEIVCKNNFELINWMEDVKRRFVLDVLPFQILKVEEKEKFIPGGG